jgi:tetratricopeptide (TPR) repeat protein
MSRVAADDLVAEANELFRLEQFSEALTRYERAAQIYPPHPLAWKGVGHSLLSLGKPYDAARAFDRAIGLAPSSATALWGGAVAHAEIGNKVVAQSYLRRTLALQPTWIEMARGVPALAAFLQVSARAGETLRAALGSFSTRTYRHTGDAARSIEVGRLSNRPRFGQWTYVTIGLSNREWPEVERPRVELILATTLDNEVCAQILANLAFHLAETGFFPEPSVMVRDVIGALGAGELSQRLPHVYITVPRAWSVELPIDPGPPPITLAQVVPVSEAEYRQWRGDVAGFEQALLRRRVDITDLRRPG